MSVLEKERKLEKAALKSKPLTAEELATRAKLLAADGSANAVLIPLGNLTRKGVLVKLDRNQSKDRRVRYTRAA